MNNPGHVFISYARQDGRDYAQRLDTDLRAAGFATWRDTRDIDPNQDFSAELERAIAASTHVVCCITPDTQRDDSFVRREISYALAVKKPVVPLVFQNTVPPIQIINVTRVDFRSQSWEQGMAELAARLQRPDDRTYEQVTPPADPYHDYLTALYEQIVRYLNLTVFSLVTLRSEATPDAIAAPERAQVLPMAFWSMAGVDEQPTDEQRRFDNFHAAFEAYNGRVLLLGEPGAGKTTTLFAFARDAVAARLQDPAKPLPILAPIATWDAQKQTRLPDWLAEQVPMLKSAEIAHLIDSGAALLLLDGLDELGAEREDPQTKERYDSRPRFLQQLTAVGEEGLRPSPAAPQTIVTCRVKDYADIGQKIALSGAITLQPLDDAQMRDYLREMPDLWAALEADDELREVARTPLLLSLFTFAFRDLPDEAKALRDLKGGDVRDRIFETYVRRRYEHEKRKYIIRHEKIPFSLEEIYEVLGSVASSEIRMGTSVQSNDRREIIRFALQLNILAPKDARRLRFIHLLLRDYFAFNHNIRLLDDPNAYRREYAVYTLGKIGDIRAVQPLLNKLKDDNFDVRRNAVDALGWLKDTQAVQPLLSLMNDEAGDIRRNVSDALWRLGDSVVPALVLALLDKDEDVRRNAVDALGLLRNPDAVEPLISALTDKETEVRSSAADALGRLGDIRAVAPLITTLNDTHHSVRASSAIALWRLGEARSIPALIQALNDDHENVRYCVALALGRLQSPEATQPLVAALADPDQYVQEMAADGLIRIGTPEALAAVEAWRSRQSGSAEE